ncbi:MAG: 50S ribosomal protein L3 [Deltaproteobacteria bacterium]|nr:50S ribosomal protein L3 [Deltaproteobacteria bacterium]
MAQLLGRKVGMTQAFGPEGEAIPVSVIKAGPCKVLQAKTVEKDGYQSVVLGFEEVEGSKIKAKAQLGAFKKLGTACFKVTKEIQGGTAETGADLNVSQFAEGDILLIEGVSKGHGWTSVIKKWNFGTGRESHGGNCQRKMGSSGMHTWPAHVIKGKKMSGRWGSEKITLRTVEVVKVVLEDHLLMVKGPLPGGRHGLLKMRKMGVKKAKQVQKEKAA